MLDLAEMVSPDELIGLVVAAVDRRRGPKRLRRRLAARPRLAQRELLTDLIAEVAAGVESPLELSYARDVERAHGLPKGEPQNRNTAGHRRDVLYREFGLLVELDGRLGHEGMGRFRDMRRDN